MTASSLLFLLVIISNAILSLAQCPSPCSCLDNYIGCMRHGLTEIPSGLQKHTKYLDVSNNAISSMGSGVSHMGSLLSLDLKNNSLTSLEKDALESLSALVSLNLASNNIEVLSPLSFHSLPKIKVIDLANNKLKSLPEGLFDDNPKLEKLDLSGNRLTASVLTVINTPNLQSLMTLLLNGNSLVYIPYASFNHLINLEELHLKNCSIRTIDANAFIGMKSLEILDISSNKLMALRREFFQVVYHIDQLDISSNPLVCSCCLKQVQDFIKEYKITMLRPGSCTYNVGSRVVEVDVVLDRLEFMCSDTDDVGRMHCDDMLTEWQEKETSSENQTGIIVCSVFIVLLLLALFGVILWFNRRKLFPASDDKPGKPNKSSDKSVILNKPPKLPGRNPVHIEPSYYDKDRKYLPSLMIPGQRRNALSGQGSTSTHIYHDAEIQYDKH